MIEPLDKDGGYPQVSIVRKLNQIVDHLNKQEPKECEHSGEQKNGICLDCGGIYKMDRKPTKPKECEHIWAYIGSPSCGGDWKCMKCGKEFFSPTEVSVEELLECIMGADVQSSKELAQTIKDKYEVRKK
jgi:hypothetical protein